MCDVVEQADLDLAQKVLFAVRSVVGDVDVPLHEPSFSGNEWNYVKECLDSTYVSSVGKFVDLFENKLAEYTGAKHAIAVVNGTAALHVALEIAGVRPNDEVLLPTLTFVATANAVKYCGGEPHFVDSEEDNFGIDPEALRVHLVEKTELIGNKCINKDTGRVIRAVVPMHTFGHPSRMDELTALAHDYNLVMIEDAAESLGSFYGNRHTGNFGQLGALSFNGNKTITTGGGGAILTNNSLLAEKVKHITTTAKLSYGWRSVHDKVGYNYRMPNLNAALGCAQIEQMPYFVAAKRNLFTRYEKAFLGLEGVSIKREPAGCESNYWLNTLVLDKNQIEHHEAILNILNGSGYMSRPAWTPLHHLIPYRECPRAELRVAENLVTRMINIPSSTKLGE
jgi:aminotransferase in exopolysaccharide biosynthesis